MNLWSTFLDLDKLHESTDEKRWTDQALDELKNKPKTEWTEDDWDTYHYCKNANAERDYCDSLDEDFYDFEPANTSNWVKMPIAANQTQAKPASTKQASVYITSTTRTPDLQQPEFCKFEQNGLWYGVIEYADRLTSTTGQFDSLYDAIAATKKTNRYTDFYIFEYDASVNKLTLVGKVDKAASQPATPSTNQSARTSTAPSKPIVTIVKDSGKLRALAANGDGQGNPAAFVQFPTVLRTNEGQQYEVDQLVWTGKFYRVSGNIRPIITNVTASTISTQNINENINKENSKMNFNSVFEELNKLYESKEPAKKVELKEEKPLKEATIYMTKAKMAQLDKAVEDAQKEVAKYNIPMKRNSAGESEPDFEAVPENQREAAKAAHDKYQKALAARPSRSQNIIKYTDEMDESLTEAAEDEEIEFAEEPVAPIEEPAEEMEPRQLILECSKCGAIVIKDEADVVVDEESDLVNVEDECEYCEEKEGYKIIGVVAPYEATEEAPVEEEPVEEAVEVKELLDIKPSVSLSLNGGEGNDVDVL